jgi:hypothetical protein
MPSRITARRSGPIRSSIEVQAARALHGEKIAEQCAIEKEDRPPVRARDVGATRAVTSVRVGAPMVMGSAATERGVASKLRVRDLVAQTPDQYGLPKPSTVVRSSSRRWSEGKSVRAWLEHRLSQTTRSPLRQT